MDDKDTDANIADEDTLSHDEVNEHIKLAGDFLKSITKRYVFDNPNSFTGTVTMYNSHAEQGNVFNIRFSINGKDFESSEFIPYHSFAYSRAGAFRLLHSRIVDTMVIQARDAFIYISE